MAYERHKWKVFADRVFWFAIWAMVTLWMANTFVHLIIGINKLFGG